MADITIDISFNSSYGSRGTGNEQFNYPSGIIFNVDKYYITDKQNQRVVIYDSDFNFVDSFGTYGTGSGEMNFPIGISTDDTSLYIAQSAIHRITKYNISNTSLFTDFGTKGTGNNQFDYPVDVKYYNNIIYVADKLNGKIKAYNSAFGFLFEISGLNFPETVEVFNGRLAVADSASDKVKFYDLGGSFVNEIHNTDFVYVTGLCNISDQLLCVIDEQGSKLYFYDADLNLINEYSTGLNFPKDAVFVDEKLFITDSANHRIVCLDTFIVEDIPFYSEQIRKLTRQLYPTGRAWWMNIGGIFDKMHEALSYSEARAYQANIDILNSIIPDNDLFSVEDAENHESALGLISNGALDLSVRKQAILRKMQYPGQIKARQDKLYLQAQLRAAGFDVYVHENRQAIGQAIYGLFNYGQSTYGGTGLADFTKVANYIDEDRDSGFNIGASSLQNFLFVVGGVTYGDRADVDTLRKKEFRELILRLKPANMVGLLLIDYI